MIINKIENLDTSKPVVMVDDNETDLDIGERFYKYANLDNPFLALNSGKDLLDYLDRVDQGLEPCPVVVLLDVNMPGLSGFETLKKVREQDEFSNIPVIVMITNSDNPRDIERSQQLGANGFQSKHYEVDTFARFLRELLG